MKIKERNPTNSNIHICVTKTPEASRTGMGSNRCISYFFICLSVLDSLEGSYHTLRMRSYAPPQKGEYLHKLFGILKHGRFVYHPLILTNLINDILILVWTHVSLFYILGYNSIVRNAFCCSNCSSFSHGEPFHVAPVFV